MPSPSRLLSTSFFSIHRSTVPTAALARFSTYPQEFPLTISCSSIDSCSVLFSFLMSLFLKSLSRSLSSGSLQFETTGEIHEDIIYLTLVLLPCSISYKIESSVDLPFRNRYCSSMMKTSPLPFSARILGYSACTNWGLAVVCSSFVQEDHHSFFPSAWEFPFIVTFRKCCDLSGDH